MPGILSFNDNAITVTDRFSDSEIMSTNMTTFATTTLSPEKVSTATYVCPIMSNVCESETANQ